MDKLQEYTLFTIFIILYSGGFKPYTGENLWFMLFTHLWFLLNMFVVVMCLFFSSHVTKKYNNLIKNLKRRKNGR